MKWEKTRRPAGPTSYDMFLKDFNKGSRRPLGQPKVTSSNINFTEEAKWYSAQTPHYNTNNNYALVQPKAFTKTIHKATQPNTWKIPKMSGPAPGSYEPTKAHDYITKKKDFTE